MVLMDFTMKDGRVATVRSCKSEDFEAMVAMFQRLNKEAPRSKSVLFVESPSSFTSPSLIIRGHDGL